MKPADLFGESFGFLLNAKLPRRLKPGSSVTVDYDGDGFTIETDRSDRTL